MDKLDAGVLDKFPPPLSTYLEPTNIDVKRLRDDRAEIQLGDEVAFVATLAFRVTHEGLALLKGWEPTQSAGLKELAAGDSLFTIAADGDLVSTGLPIDADGLSKWIAERYEFAFLLNGGTHHAFGPVGRGRVATDDTGRGKPAQPWIQKLNTAAIKDDYIDVDVQITERSKPVDTTARKFQFVLGTAAHDLDGPTRLVAQLVLQTSATAKLAGRTIDVPLEGCADGAWLHIAFSEQPDSVANKPVTDPARGNPKLPK